MSEIFKQSFPRSLDQLIEHYNNDAHRGATIEAWLFEDEATRRAGERILTIHGITAHLRSAYKPLVHAVLEEIDLSDATAIEIAYPRHEVCTENRFRLDEFANDGAHTLHRGRITGPIGQKDPVGLQRECIGCGRGRWNDRHFETLFNQHS